MINNKDAARSSQIVDFVSQGVAHPLKIFDLVSTRQVDHR